MKIIECVPNFSEGQNIDVVEKIADSIREVQGVQLLDYSRDVDHHRSVFTFIGTPEAVKQAAYDSAEMAMDCLDINEHQGVHPRSGVVDVIPFIPVRGTRLKDCVKIAHELGYELETHLHLPSYYYEEATTEERYKNLTNLRQDAHNLKQHPKAGCVAIGARDFLLSLNANLATDDMEKAKQLAKAVRGKDGGHKFIKALAFFLASKKQAQVSMCITNPRKFPRKKVEKYVSEKAQELNIPIKEFELIGLEPETVIKAAKRFRV